MQLEQQYVGLLNSYNTMSSGVVVKVTPAVVVQSFTIVHWTILVAWILMYVFIGGNLLQIAGASLIVFYMLYSLRKRKLKKNPPREIQAKPEQFDDLEKKAQAIVAQAAELMR